MTNPISHPNDWKIIPGSDNLYFASREGRIFSMISRKEVKCSDDGQGYMKFRINGKMVRRSRAIMLTWTKGGSNKYRTEVNHKNGVRSDDRLENLEWVTPSENVMHSFRELQREVKRGSKNGSAILDEDKVMDIVKLLSTNTSRKEISEKYKVSSSTITAIATGQNWSHLTGIGVNNE
jgi:hypothetical protein